MNVYPMSIPDVINAGDTVEFTLHAFNNAGAELTAAAGYTMYLVLNNSTNFYSATTTTSDSSGFLMSIPSTATTGWTAGSYNASVFVADGTNRYQVTSKYITVKPNLLAGVAVDSRSTIRKTLDALNAAILGSATDNQMSMSIAGRSIQRMSIEELIKAKQQFENMVRDEDRLQDMIDGKPSRNTVNIRFK